MRSICVTADHLQDWLTWSEQNAGVLPNQVDPVFTVSHPVRCPSSHGLTVSNRQTSDIDGHTLVDSETWNLPKILKSHKSVKSARQIGCLVNCPQPHICTYDKKNIYIYIYIPQENIALLIYEAMNFFEISSPGFQT